MRNPTTSLHAISMADYIAGHAPRATRSSSSTSSTNIKAASRLGHKKSRTGCRTCRSRRVKVGSASLLNSRCCPDQHGCPPSLISDDSFSYLHLQASYQNSATKVIQHVATAIGTKSHARMIDLYETVEHRPTSVNMSLLAMSWILVFLSKTNQDL